MTVCKCAGGRRMKYFCVFSTFWIFNKQGTLGHSHCVKDSYTLRTISLKSCAQSPRSAAQRSNSMLQKRKKKSLPTAHLLSFSSSLFFFVSFFSLDFKSLEHINETEKISLAFSLQYDSACFWWVFYNGCVNFLQYWRDITLVDCVLLIHSGY